MVEIINMPQSAEHKSVKSRIVEYATEIGWSFISRNEAEKYRGIVVSMIHKFRDMQADISLCKNIFVLIDEARSTTQGDLGNSGKV